MNRNDAIGAAEHFVKWKYGFVPPILSVSKFELKSYRGKPIVFATVWERNSATGEFYEAKTVSEVAIPHASPNREYWLIAFQMPWDAAERLLPETLHVGIDESGEHVSQVEWT
jgi:hypothetical protein